MIAASVVLLLGGVIVLWYIVAYNGLVSARNRARAGLGGCEGGAETTA